MWELTKSFRFEAAHALPGTTLGAPARKSTATRFAPKSASAARPIPQPAWCSISACSNAAWPTCSKTLDHKLLNKVEALGPPTLENLSRFIWERVQHAGKITRVSVHRDSCNESCTYLRPAGLGILTVIARSDSDEAIHRCRSS